MMLTPPHQPPQRTNRSVRTQGEPSPPDLSPQSLHRTLGEIEALRGDFDVALIAAGSYGMPLAAAIKRMGKGAIYVGGGLQVAHGACARAAGGGGARRCRANVGTRRGWRVLLLRAHRPVPDSTAVPQPPPPLCP